MLSEGLSVAWGSQIQMIAECRSQLFEMYPSEHRIILLCFLWFQNLKFVKIKAPFIKYYEIINDNFSDSPNNFSLVFITSVGKRRK